MRDTNREKCLAELLEGSRQLMQDPNDVAEMQQILHEMTMHQASIEDLEDFVDVYTAEKRSEDLQAGRSFTVPLSEVMAKYGLKSDA